MSFPLLERAKKDPAAFGQLYEQHFDAVYKYFYFRTRDQEEAEDLTSSTWEKIVTHIGSFEADQEVLFKGWMFKIARNTLFEHYRRQKPQVSLEDIEVASQEDFTQEIHAKTEAEKLKILIQGLPEVQQEILRLHFFAELKNKEIAEIIQEEERTMAVYLSRALKALQKRSEMML
jgi:RNA polymerase sigma-70 factor, ECF subfamily